MAAHGSQATYYDDSAALYADPRIRLHYPQKLYERVYAFAGPAAEAALDVACGTGQCAVQLAREAGAKVALDLASFEVVREFRADVEALLQSKQIDCCFCNEVRMPMEPKDLCSLPLVSHRQ